MSGWKVVCAWCGAHIRGDPEAERTSHGVCGPCYEKALAASKEAAESRASKEGRGGGT